MLAVEDAVEDAVEYTVEYTVELAFALAVKALSVEDVVELVGDALLVACPSPHVVGLDPSSLAFSSKLAEFPAGFN